MSAGTFSSAQYQIIRKARREAVNKICHVVGIDSTQSIKMIARQLQEHFAAECNAKFSAIVLEQAFQGYQHFGGRQNSARFAAAMKSVAESATDDDDRALIEGIDPEIFTREGACELAGPPGEPNADMASAGGALTLAVPAPQLLAAVQGLHLPGNAQFALAAGLGILRQRSASHVDSPQFTPPGSRVTSIAVRNEGHEVKLELTFGPAEAAPKKPATLPDLGVFLELGFTAIELVGPTGEPAAWALIPPGYFQEEWQTEGIIPCRMQTAFVSAPVQ